MCLQTVPSTVKHPRVTPTYAFLVFAAGLGLAWLVLRGRGAALAERLKAAGGRRREARLRARVGARREGGARGGRRPARAELAAERAGAEARVAELRSAHERLKGEFAELSASALRANRDDFLKLAEQSFTQLQEKSAGDLAGRQQAIDSLVKPLRDSLEKVDAKINELEQRRERAYGELGKQLESLNSTQLRMHAETTKLSTALSTTRTAGTWGEVQLRRVVELAGMTEHCDFAEQKVYEGEEGRSRPDLVVSLPGGQRVVVDAKAPTDAYREAAAEADPERRLEKLKEHAAKVRGHVEALASREYWAKIQPVARVRGPLPAGRLVPVGRYRVRSLDHGPRDQQARAPRHADDACRAPEGGGLRLAPGGGLQERRRAERARPHALRPDRGRLRPPGRRGEGALGGGQALQRCDRLL